MALERFRIMTLWSAIKTAHRLKGQPLAVKKDGARFYYNADEDVGQTQYNFARWEIAQWPRVNRILMWMRLI